MLFRQNSISAASFVRIQLRRRAHLNNITTMLTDLRFALRQLLKSPGFTLLAVVTLMLGIGLNTTIFSLINDLFLRGLPFKDSSRLVRFYSGTKTAKALEWPISGPRFQLYREGQTIFDGFAADNPTAATLTG